MYIRIEVRWFTIKITVNKRFIGVEIVDDEYQSTGFAWERGDGLRFYRDELPF